LTPATGRGRRLVEPGFALAQGVVVRERTFSIVVPSYQMAGCIGDCLRSVTRERTAAPIADVIVSDDGSTDGTIDTARRCGATVLEGRSGERRTLAGLRNSGARAAGGDVLVFLDADMVAPPGWLARARERFAGGFEGALGFAFTAPPEAGWVGRIWGDRMLARRRGVAAVGFLPTGNLLVSRSVFDRVGGFDEALPAGEDKDFSLRVRRAGYSLVCDPTVVLSHLGYERGLREFVRKEWWRQGHTLAAARAEGYTFRSLRNPLFSAWHVVAPAGAGVCLAAGCAVAGGVLLVLWVLPALMCAGADARRQGWRRLLPLLFLVWVRWTVAGVGLVAQLARRRREPDA
jgi:glycosyltransferase involved in cell wall biosynthesis